MRRVAAVGKSYVATGGVGQRMDCVSGVCRLLISVNADVAESLAEMWAEKGASGRIDTTPGGKEHTVKAFGNSCRGVAATRTTLDTPPRRGPPLCHLTTSR